MDHPPRLNLSSAGTAAGYYNSPLPGPAGGLDVVSPMQASSYSYDKQPSINGSPGVFRSWLESSRGGNTPADVGDAELSQMVAELRHTIQKQDEDLVTLRASLSDAAAYASAQYSRVTELETEKQALAASLRAASSDKESLLDQLGSLMTTVAELEEKIAQPRPRAPQDGETKASEAAAAPPVVREESAKLRASQTELTALYERVQYLQVQLERARQDASDARKALAVAKESKSAAAAAAMSRSDHDAEVTRLQNQHRVTVSTLEDHVAQLRQQVSALKPAAEAKESLEVEVQWQRNRLHSLEATLEEERSALRSMRSELQAAKSRATQLEERSKAKGPPPPPPVPSQEAQVPRKELETAQARVVQLEDERDGLKTEVKRLQIELMSVPKSPPQVVKEEVQTTQRVAPPPPQVEQPRSVAETAPNPVQDRRKWSPVLQSIGGLKESLQLLRREVAGAWAGFRTDVEEPVYGAVKAVAEDTLGAVLGAEGSAADNYHNRKPWVEQAPIDVVHSELDGKVRLSKQAARELTEVFAASAASRMDALLYRQEVLQREMSQDFSQQEGELSLLIQQVANYQGKKATHRQLRGQVDASLFSTQLRFC